MGPFLEKPVFPELVKKYLHLMEKNFHDVVQNSLLLAPIVSHINTVSFLQSRFISVPFQYYPPVYD